MTRRRARIVLAVGSAALALLVVELACRVAEWRDASRRRARTRVHYTLETATGEGVLLSDEPGTVRLVLDPALGFRLAPDRSAPGISIGPAGLRGPPFARAKPPGAFRIVLTGGSVAFGWGASSDAACVAPRLAALLSTPERPVEVLNAGCPAYTLGQEFLWLSFELLDLEPDLVVSLTGHNDLWDAYTGSALVSHELFRQLEQRLGEARRLGPALLHASALGRRLARKLGPATAAPERLPEGLDARREAAARRFAALLARTGAIAPGRLLVALQPSWLSCPPGSRPPAEVEAVEGWLSRTLVDRAGFAAFHARMRADQRDALGALAGSGNRGVDLGDALVAAPEVAFTDLVHLTDAGNARLAERLAAEVRAHPAWVAATGR